MVMYDDIAMKLAEHRHGVVATWELAQHGVSEHQIRQLMRSRHWEQVARSVLRRRGAPSTDDQETASRVLDRGPGAFVSHMSGSHLLGIKGAPLRPVTVVGEMATRTSRLDTNFHRVRRVPRRWTTEVRGIPVVAPELCAMQLYACCSPQSAERRVDALWSMGRLSGRSIAVFLGEMGASGRNGIAGLRRYLDDRGPDYRPPDSGMESRAIQVLRSAGIEIRRQIDVGAVEAWTGRVDLMVVGLPVVVEIQSDLHHRSKINRERDEARRRQLERDGFTWCELWEEDVWGHPWLLAPTVQAAIDTALARRASAPPL